MFELYILYVIPAFKYSVTKMFSFKPHLRYSYNNFVSYVYSALYVSCGIVTWPSAIILFFAKEFHLRVCVCVYIHARTYIHKQTYVRTYTHKYIHTYVHAYIHTDIHIHTYIQTDSTYALSISGI